MANKKKDKISPQASAIRDALKEMVGELYDQHADEIEKFRVDSEADKVTVNFKGEIDCSESEPVVSATIRFSQSVTDKRFARLDDPNQLNLLSERPEPKDNPPAEGQDELPANKRTRRVKDAREESAEQSET